MRVSQTHLYSWSKWFHLLAEAPLVASARLQCLLVITWAGVEGRIVLDRLVLPGRSNPAGRFRGRRDERSTSYEPNRYLRRDLTAYGRCHMGPVANVDHRHDGHN